MSRPRKGEKTALPRRKRVTAGDVARHAGVSKAGVAICGCNDGLRPVIFKIERAVEEANGACTPVK